MGRSCSGIAGLTPIIEKGPGGEKGGGCDALSRMGCQGESERNRETSSSVERLRETDTLAATNKHGFGDFARLAGGVLHAGLGPAPVRLQPRPPSAAEAAALRPSDREPQCNNAGSLR